MNDHPAAGGGTGEASAILAIALSREATDTLEGQLYAQLRDHILTGRIASGTRLPSTRALARELGISRTVTLGAYDRLAAEGYVEPRPGSGQFVRAIPVLQAPAPAVSGPEERPERGRPRRDFPPFGNAALPAPGFPLETWSRLIARGWRREGAAAAGAPGWAGLPSLRKAIADHVRALRGYVCGPDNILVTSGNADALRLIGAAWRSELEFPRSRIWIEDPCWPAARTTLCELGLEPVPVPVDREGMIIDAALRLAPEAGAALVTPSRQFPLGTPLSLPRRLALLEWARRSGALLIEDEYDTEIRFAGRPIPSLGCLDPDSHVLTLGSFSKLTFPGLRLGYIAGAEPLVARLAEARMRSNSCVPTAAQPALAEFISAGGFAKHLRGLRRTLLPLRNLLSGLIEERLGPLVDILPQEAGMYLTVHLSGELAARSGDAELARAGRRRGLELSPLSRLYRRGPPMQGFVLGYAHLDRIAIERGVEILRSLICGPGSRGPDEASDTARGRRTPV